MNNFLQGVPIVAGIGPGAENPPNQRLVHLDLKGAPPKVYNTFRKFSLVNW